jgi:hypothetical protein
LDDVNRRLEVDLEDLGSFTERTLVNGVWETKTVEKQRVVCFQDMVKDNWKILNQIYSLQKPALGVELPTTFRGHIEGFDFADIVHSAVEMIPRSRAFGSHGRAWLDFAKAINAITLFGNGFGELVIPAAGSNKLCEHWRTVPKGLNYLVASVAHLDQLSEVNFDRQETPPNPVELCKGIYWRRGHRLFEHCNGCTSAQPCDRAQDLLAPILESKVAPGPLKDGRAGVVVFGKSRRHSLRGSKDNSQSELLPQSQSDQDAKCGCIG